MGSSTITGLAAIHDLIVQRDAWKVLQRMSEADERGSLAESFSPPPLRFGRVEGISVWDQVRFEGWILGVE